ncbi:hypothetical protein LCGC14_1851760 [marine sediment metagenome]|uniref:Uncharacterized protein n=1 Tax=marine sediment metagenome TaxID=412755 RepID=A0A0F9IPN7_9ZZZZ
MVNANGLMNDIELRVEIQELEEMGLTEEEILGYIEFYYDSWVVFSNILILN